MSDETAFRRAIRATPADDVPRLIYADWLEEVGQAERARFIRLQCQAAALPICDVRRGPIEAEARRLLHRHELDWSGPGVSTWADWSWERGMITEIQLNGLPQEANCLAVWPIERLGLKFPSLHPRRFAAGPWAEVLETIHELELHLPAFEPCRLLAELFTLLPPLRRLGMRVGDHLRHWWAMLEPLPAWGTALRELSVEFSASIAEPTHQGIEPFLRLLSRHPWGRTLRTLDLGTADTWQALQVRGLRCLPLAPDLEGLTLKTDAEGMTELLAQGAFPNLRRLRWSGDVLPITLPNLANLARLEVLEMEFPDSRPGYYPAAGVRLDRWQAPLHRLALGHQPVRVELVEDFLASPACANLREFEATLVLRSSQQWQRFVQRLTHQPWYEHLRRLRLEVRGEAPESLAWASLLEPFPAYLESLELSIPLPASEGTLRSWFKQLPWSSLQRLRLEGLPRWQPMLESLGEYASAGALRQLALESPLPLTAASLAELMRWSGFASLQRLEVFPLAQPAWQVLRQQRYPTWDKERLDEVVFWQRSEWAQRLLYVHRRGIGQLRDSGG